MSTELVKIDPKEFGLEEKKASELTKGLSHILAEREELAKSYNACIDMEITLESVPKFKQLRLKIRDNRTKGIEAWHKANKAYFLAGGNFVDKIKRKEVLVNEQMEEKLLDGEKFYERQEAERLAKIEAERKALIEQYTEILPVGLGTMQQEVFDNYLTGLKAAHEARIEAERKAEQEREKYEAERIEAQKRKQKHIDREYNVREYGRFFDWDSSHIETTDEEFNLLIEKAEKTKQAHEAEQAKIKADNERLEKERIAAEKQRAKELAAIEAERKRIEAERQKEIEAERKLKAELQAQLQAKEDAERKAKDEAQRIEHARIEAEKKAALAPDKDKILAWIKSMEVEACVVKSTQAISTVAVIQTKFEAFKNWAISQTNNL